MHEIIEMTMHDWWGPSHSLSVVESSFLGFWGFFWGSMGGLAYDTHPHSRHQYAIAQVRMWL